MDGEHGYLIEIQRRHVEDDRRVRERVPIDGQAAHVDRSILLDALRTVATHLLVWSRDTGHNHGGPEAARWRCVICRAVSFCDGSESKNAPPIRHADDCPAPAVVALLPTAPAAP